MACTAGHERPTTSFPHISTNRLILMESVISSEARNLQLAIVEDFSSYLLEMTSRNIFLFVLKGVPRK
jgi:hypothetical protein